MTLLVVSDAQLIIAALAGILALVLLITLAKLNPFLSLTIGALIVGAIGGLSLTQMMASYSKGFGDTMASVGVLIALGAIVGKLMADSGGADRLVDTIVGKASPTAIPWAMALVGAVIGLPMFFEIGLVLLVPVIILVAKRSGLSLMKVGIPALAGLSTMHALVPPHPGPLAAIAALKADLGITLGFGVLVAIPTVVLAGPVLANFIAKLVPVETPHLFLEDGDNGRAGIAPRQPSLGLTLLTVLLPVVLMLGKSLADIFISDPNNGLRHGLDFIGAPLIALLITALAALFTQGFASGMDKKQVADTVGKSLPPIAGILLIVAAGGGFKQVLVDTGIGKMLGTLVHGNAAAALLVAYIIAVLIRLATGSATVATVTTAGLVLPFTVGMSPMQASLLVLAIGCGSVFFSHVNDAGFWLVKEYFGTSLKQTVLSWSLMETVLSVVGFIIVFLLSLVMGAAG